MRGVRLAGISSESLPLLFQDAVKAARSLKIHYLWIYSLCIFQDSNEDWATESSRIGDIYRNSLLALFYLDSINGHEGILNRRLNPTACADGSNFLRLRRGYFRTWPLYQRAWAVQKLLLSPRILYLSKNEMLWKCLDCTAMECSRRIVAYQPLPCSDHRYECVDPKKRLITDAGPYSFLPITPPEDRHVIFVEYTH
jgi:hypothetical protein